MNPNRMEKTAIAVTRWIGSTQSIFVHTVLFAIAIALLLANVFPFNVVILVFNTIVSLEAIYLALFIQMTVNYQARSLEEVSEDIDEIQEDIDELQEDVEDISEDVEEMSEDEAEEESRDAAQHKALTEIQNDLRKLAQDIQKLQSK